MYGFPDHGFLYNSFGIVPSFRTWSQSRTGECPSQKELSIRDSKKTVEVAKRCMKGVDALPCRQQQGHTWDPRNFQFQRVRPNILHDTRKFADCILSSSGSTEGKACLSIYLSLLPKDLTAKATADGKHRFALGPVKDNPQELVTALRGCMHVAGEWAGAL
jgi:hypothetical protein